MHDTMLQRKAFVGYVVEGRHEPPGFLQVQGTETDEAEERAILFAITELKNRLKRFKVICDHESAVVKVNWKGDDRRKAKKDKVLPEIWKVLDKNKSIRVRALGGNPAHAFLNKRLKEIESGTA
jgi:ribonuclease HI